LKPSSIRGQALTPLSGIFKHAVRRGWRSDNPVRNLEADEKPTIESRPKRILEENEIRTLIEGRRPCEALEARFGGNVAVTSEGDLREKTGTDGVGSVVSMRPERPLR
jgi:hypothetical protein